MERYGAHEAGTAGSFKRALFVLCGHPFYCFDSPVKHGFAFKPAVSLFIDVDDEAKMGEVFATLANGGKVLMPLDSYDFSKKFGWPNDRFGVSWQHNMHA